jgi:hypothetical protein
MTVFDTKEAAGRALTQRINDLEEDGHKPIYGEVVAVKEEEV